MFFTKCKREAVKASKDYQVRIGRIGRMGHIGRMGPMVRGCEGTEKAGYRFEAVSGRESSG